METGKEKKNQEALLVLIKTYNKSIRLLKKQIKNGDEVERKKEELLQLEQIKLVLKDSLERLRSKEEKGKKKGSYRAAGHLIDQRLKYNYPRETASQRSLFDSLEESTQKEIQKQGIEVTEIVEGIRLSPPETKIIDCLCKLLHDSSENKDKKAKDYYSGNKGVELVQFAGETSPAPKLAFTLYELSKEYKGGEAPSGKDIEIVRQILQALDDKKFLLSYIETAHKKEGGRIERKIEEFRKLIHIVKISLTEYSRENTELSKKEDTVIILNPIFKRQIDSKFIKYPHDINKRTIIAYGSHNLSEIALRLRDYLIREHSSKRYTPEVYLEKLYYILAEKWMKESRKSKVKQYTEKALETVKALGLLSEYEITQGAAGEQKIVFTLNKEFE
jgi:hypothetical protein